MAKRSQSAVLDLGAATKKSISYNQSKVQSSARVKALNSISLFKVWIAPVSRGTIQAPSSTTPATTTATAAAISAASTTTALPSKPAASTTITTTAPATASASATAITTTTAPSEAVRQKLPRADGRHGRDQLHGDLGQEDFTQ